MAADKRSFLLYCDLIHTVKELNDTKAGKLFKHILAYVNDENPKTDDPLLKIAFEPVKRQLKRDLVKYEAIRLRNKENAAKRWGKENTKTCDRIPPHTKNADNDNDNDNGSVIKGAAPHQETLSVFDAEQDILKNQIQFERICMSCHVEPAKAKKSLRKYHLYLEEKHQYPKSKKAVLAGFEKWLMNEQAFSPKSEAKTETMGPKYTTL